jgi:hypothetical protein
MIPYFDKREQITPPESNLDGLPEAILQGVGDNVRDGLVEPQPIPSSASFAVDTQRERKVGMDVDEAVKYFLNQYREIEGSRLEFDLTRADPADVEQAFNQGNYPIELNLEFFARRRILIDGVGLECSDNR